MPTETRRLNRYPLAIDSRAPSVEAAVALTLLAIGITASGCEGVLDMGTTEASANEGGSPTMSAVTPKGTGGGKTTSGSGGRSGSESEGGQVSGGAAGSVATGGASPSAFGGQTSSTTGGTSTSNSSGGTIGGTAAILQTARKGMTWGKMARFYLSKLEWLGCNGEPLVDGTNYCDARLGDTDCRVARPILCLESLRAPRPGYSVPESPGGTMVDEYYAGWAGGRVATTPAVVGSLLTSQARADEICREAFGGSWQMAEFHDGWWIAGMSASAFANETWEYAQAARGGWAFFASVDAPIPETTRYWVAISDQKANCWDEP